jgi:hypothetical protein
MRKSLLAVITTLGVAASPGFAADATSPIDYRQRNEPFAPADSVSTGKQKPATNRNVQDKRVDKATVEKKTAPVQDRQAAIEMKETRPKEVREKESRRPEATEHVTSGFDHRQAAISTAGDTNKPPTVAKYQDSLTAASATNMARYPAMDKATSAKINRFVFRKNPADASGAVNGSPVVPAAGGSVLQK